MTSCKVISGASSETLPLLSVSSGPRPSGSASMRVDDRVAGLGAGDHAPVFSRRTFASAVCGLPSPSLLLPLLHFLLDFRGDVLGRESSSSGFITSTYEMVDTSALAAFPFAAVLTLLLCFYFNFFNFFQLVVARCFFRNKQRVGETENVLKKIIYMQRNNNHVRQLHPP